MSNMLALLIAIALIAFLGVAARSLRGDARPSRRPDAEAELQALCQGDPARAERLIELELRRAPKLTRAQAVLRAIERYRHDNR
jgi:hypothetical protein